MAQDAPGHFILQTVIGPLYEEWHFNPATVDQQFQKDPDGDYRCGWRIYDPRLERWIDSPFRIAMRVGDTLYFEVASRDKTLNVAAAKVEFNHDNGPPTPFRDHGNPWKDLPETTDRSFVNNHWQWDWPKTGRQPIVAENGIWDLSATVTLLAGGKAYPFGFDPRMCVGGGCD